ncbi:hypothetical protein [Polaribacter atrinae]|uniref:hypothetical protein n=1 Tax=Polaribacter atrinae TaxID=1333662 RepID=UPI0024938A2B|nr:hypothetical protein [Polaribacter atrinae]
MKKLYILVVFLFLILNTNAQLQVSLNVDSNPTPEISEWVNRTNLAILTVTNTDPDWEPDYKIKVEMYKDGNKMFETNNNVITQTLELGTVTFLADEIIPYNAINFTNNSFEQTVLQTGMLPAGEYSFCLSLIHVDTGLPLTSSPTSPICQPMIMTAYQMPELINPISNVNFDSQLVPTITFNWTPVTPMPPADLGVKYIIAISEVYSGQSSATQAFHINTPIIEEEILVGTQFTWPSDIDAPDELTQYVWSVKALSTSNDNQYQQGVNGFVPPQTFTITPAADQTVEDCECDTYNLTQPVVEIVQLESNNYPRKLSLTNVTQLRDYLINCQSLYSDNSENYTIEATINWGEDHASESILGNNAFEHLYNTNTHEIPEEICINYTINPMPGISGGQCVRQFCIDVPENLLNLNTSDTDTDVIAVGESIHAGQNHEFEVKVTEVAIDSATNKITGKGNVYVNWLGSRVAVKFNAITLDTNKNLLTGNILGEIYDAPAPVYPQAWGEEIIANNNTANNVATSVANWGNDVVGDVIDWTNNTSGDAVEWINNTAGTSIDAPIIDPQAPIPDGPLTDNTEPVKLPLGVNYANGDQFAITEIVFRSNLSEFNLVAAKNTPPSWQAPGEDPQLIGFKAVNVKFHPDSVETPPERLELVENVNIGNMNNKVTFTFISPANSSNGCYIEWDENGFSEIGIELVSSFTRDWFIPVPDDGTSRSKASFVGTIQDWDAFVLTGNLEKSELVDSQGMTIMAGNISIDLSDTLNPISLQTASDFPENYTGENTMLFRGFHMEELTVGMPDSWQTNNDGTPTLSVYDMIINDTGVTLVAEATNVAAFRGANVADLIASIDTVHVDIRSSSFHDAYVKGKIGLPISKADSIQNPLKYNALFSTATQTPSFQLTIEPTGPINASLMKGTMELDQTSNIVAYVDTNKKTFQSTLNGNFVWDDVKLGPVKHINMNLGFQGLEMNYNSSLTNKFNFNVGSWAFASPQKFMSNFPVTIENIDFNEKTSTGNQLIHGDLNFDVIFNLTEDIGGQSKMAVEMAIEDNPGGSGVGKFKPKYISTGIDDISIYAHLPAVSIDGTLAFRNDHPVYGNGFKGTLNASFKTPSIGITALAEFGNTNYLNNGATYRYWRVEAAAKFSAGIPFLPGVAFYGFGGGAYKNMEGALVASSGSTPAHYSFSPKKGNLGFQVEATIGAAAKVESFNADVGLNGQFSSSDGLINIGFTGDFYIGGPLLPQTERDKAQVKGNVIVDYNFPNKHFFMNVDASVDTDVISTPYPANLNVDINGTTNKWHFKFGQPSALNTVEVFGISLYEYLTFGNNIETPSGFTQTFKNGWASVWNGDQPGIPVGSGVDNNSALGKGFAFGVGFQFDKNLNQNLINGYSVNLDVAAGAELNLSMIQKTGINCKDSSKEFGLNGWRAGGSVGFYGAVDAYVSKNSKRWDLLNVKAGGWLEGKFPGPTYVAGEVRGQAKIGRIKTWIHLLGDCKKDGGAYHLGHSLQWTACTHYQYHYLVNKSFEKQFDWGTDCNGTDPTSNQIFTQQDAAADQAQRLITYIKPDPSSLIYNYEITKPISIKYGLTPDEEFDVGEQQSTGAVVTRIFKLERQVKMYVDEQDNGVYVEIPKNTQLLQPNRKTLIMSNNNLGEELYTIDFININENINMQAQIANPIIDNNQPNSINNMQMAAVTSTGSILNAGVFSSNTLQNKQTATVVRFPAAPTDSGSATSNTELDNEEEGETGTANYGTLPPAAAPLVNNLDLNKTYKIIITATLKEKINNIWVNAKKSDNSSVTETKEKLFRTGPIKQIEASKADVSLTKEQTTPNNTNTPKTVVFTKKKVSPIAKKVIIENKKILEKNKAKKKSDKSKKRVSK